jgi:DNA end-binding protein Ku
MHAIWKGTLSFGLVNIPVHLITASREKELSFVLLHKNDLSTVRYARICKKEDKEIPWNEIVKGYEFESGNYVVLNEQDFEKANLKKTKSIEISGFVQENEIDSIYYVKPYFLEPGENAGAAYGLFCEALKRSGKVALAHYVLHHREHMAVVKAHKNSLVLNELRYNNELISVKELNLPETAEFKKKELDMALQLIEHLTTHFKPQEYKDTYIEELKALIKQKTKGRTIHPHGEQPKASKVQDIMSLLEASLEEKKKPQKRVRKAG